MNASLRIVFFGSDAIAHPLLEWLTGNAHGLAQIVGVFTQPDRPVGRGQNVQPNAIKSWALGHGVPLWQPEKITDEVRAGLAALQADLGLVMAYGHILRDDFIGTPRLGMLNLHTSLLPRFRGASPIQSAMAGGARETGVTLMRIVRRLDAGPIADVERVGVDPLDTALEVERKLAGACVPLLARCLPRLREGTLNMVAQEDGAATYCRKLEKEDGAVDFAAPAAKIAARINGLFPWPSCTLELGGLTVKLGLADALAGEGNPAENTNAAGTVLGSDAAGLRVSTGGGVLRLRKLQRPGGRMLPAAEFLRGFPLVVGTRLPSRPMPDLETRR